MSPERWEQIKEVLQAALELQPEERSLYLDRACSTDHSLRQEVESLLSESDQVRSSFLQSPPIGRSTLMKGASLGSYEIVSLIGAGGMGEVYRARDLRLRRDVAIKVLPSFVSFDKERLRRFEQEAQAAAALNHPNILAVHQMGTYEGAPYLVSELLEGETLREEIGRGPLPARKAIDQAVQIARGLAAAHGKGIAHRDLKPENLFVTKDGRGKILDFGLAKLTEAPLSPDHSTRTVVTETAPGVVMGTVGYMSPEQVRGEAADYRTDIFALGAILYEMLSGRRAFQKPTSAETMSAILNEDPPPLSQLVPNVPIALTVVVQRCLEKSPEQRFQSASDLAFALAELSASAVVVPATSTKAGRKTSPRRRWLIGLTGASAIVIGLLAYWISPPSGRPRVLSSTQLTYDGLPKQPPVLTDGSRLYYAAMSPPRNPYEVSIAGGEPARLPMPNMTPFLFLSLAAISVDGSELLLQSTEAYLWRGPLWAIPTVPGPGHRINNVTSGDAAWFPSGDRIIYASGNALYVVKRDGTGSRQLVKLNGTPSWIRWSPGGQFLRFTVTDRQTKATSLWEVMADGSGLHALLAGWNDPSANCCGAWTNDGKYFVFQSTHNFRSDIWAIQEKPGLFRRRNPIPVQLTNGPLSFQGPQPSYDGRKLFVVGVQPRGELVRYDMKSNQFVPYLSGISADTVDFSRDGQWVTYVAVPEGTLWRSKVDGSEKLQLSFPPMVAYLPRWSPDGKRIAFQGISAGKPWTMYIVSADGGSLEEIKPWPGDPSWSPDGNSLVFSTAPLVFGPGASTKSTIQIMDLKSQQVSTLPGSEGLYSPRWSPDGRHIAAQRADSETLRVFDLSRAKWSNLGRIGVSYPNWSPDSKYIYFRSLEEVNPWLGRLRIADAKLDRIGSLKGIRQTGVFGFWWVGLSPDGSPLVLRDIGTHEIYALDVDLP